MELKHNLTIICVFVLLAVMLLIASNAQGVPQPRQKLDLGISSVKAAYVSELTEKSRAAKTEARAWAKARGIPVRYEQEHQVYELMFLLDDRPVFFKTLNYDAAIVTATDLVRNTAPYNLNGSGQIAGIWDAGAVRSTHQEFGGRVNIMDGSSSDSHSTHVGGTIGAAGIVLAALGMAPSVTIHSYDWDNDLAEAISAGATGPGQSDKIYVSNHSYGAVLGWRWVYEYNAYAWSYFSPWNGSATVEAGFGQYNEWTHNIDEAIYFAQYVLPFSAAGNDRNDNPTEGETVYYSTDGGASWNPIPYSTSTCPGGDGTYENGYDTIGFPQVAKNMMTVGAVDDSINMESYSSWGPADDGRIKPDIVANGNMLYSSTALSDSSYSGSYSGTSMASANASGSAILLVEYYGELFPGQSMRASTLKGLIIHTADDVGNPGPDYKFGWGLMNTKAAADIIKQQHDFPLSNMIVEAVLNSGSTSDDYVFQWDGITPAYVTLCWTDPPGAATSSHDDSTPKLINDLDVRVFGPDDSVYYPYVLDASDPSAAAVTGDNTLDNVEQVYIPTPGVIGEYTVQVSYKGVLTYNEQYYSLIAEITTLPFDLNTFAVLASYWMENNCNELNNWCDGTDLYPSGNVDYLDLSVFTEHWLEGVGP